MAAPTNAAYVKKALANPEPSTHGPREDISYRLAADRLMALTGKFGVLAGDPFSSRAARLV